MTRLPPGPQRKDGVKFMQVLDRRIYGELRKTAKSKGVSVQELLRVAVVPSYLEAQTGEIRRRERNMAKRLARRRRNGRREKR